MKSHYTFLALFLNLLLNAQNYIPDPTFGNNGSVVTNYNMYYDNNQAPTNVFLQNNKYIFTQKTQLSAFNYDGSVDFSFGTSGYSRIIDPNCSSCSIVIKDSKIINNTIFVYGKSINSNYTTLYGFIAKMSLDGILDTNFGNNGILTVTIGHPNFNDPYSSGITDIVYKNGNYFAIGNIVYQDSNSIYRRNIFTVKLNDNGVVDLLYEPNVLKKITSIDGHSAEKIDEYQGEFLIIGHITNNNTGDENALTLVKIDESGNLNTTFGINGVKKLQLSLNGWQTGENFKKCILIGDEVYYARSYFIYSYGWQKIQKINISDLTTTDICFIDKNAKGAYMIDNNKVYALDCISNCQPDFAITVRNIDGSLDTTFNQTGTYSYDFPSPSSIVTSYDSATVFVKSNSNILIGGYTAIAPQYTTAPYTGFAMHRITEGVLSNDNKEINNFSVFPNPVSTTLTIENQNNITIEKIVISDISGKMVYYIEKPINTINLENLTRGMYLVNIFTSDKKECFKILKED